MQVRRTTIPLGSRAYMDAVLIFLVKKGPWGIQGLEFKGGEPKQHGNVPYGHFLGQVYRTSTSYTP